jgi:hypothetical protein
MYFAELCPSIPWHLVRRDSSGAEFTELCWQGCVAGYCSSLRIHSGRGRSTLMSMVLANSVLTAIDGDDPAPLANFYAQIIGGKIHEFEFDASGERGWVEIRDGEVRLLALQKVTDYQLSN